MPTRGVRRMVLPEARRKAPEPNGASIGGVGRPGVVQAVTVSQADRRSHVIFKPHSAWNRVGNRYRQDQTWVTNRDCELVTRHSQDCTFMNIFVQCEDQVRHHR